MRYYNQALTNFHVSLVTSDDVHITKFRFSFDDEHQLQEYSNNSIKRVNESYHYSLTLLFKPCDVGFLFGQDSPARIRHRILTQIQW